MEVAWGAEWRLEEKGTEGEWKAKLQHRATHFEGAPSRSISFAAGGQGDKGKLACLQFMQRWHASQTP